jgi:protein kinase C substrate 80K-H
LNDDLNRATDDLEKDYGSENEWLKLKDVCIEKDEGE